MFTCAILGGLAAAATISASTVTAVVGGAAVVSTATAIGLKAYADHNESENEAICKRANKRAQERIKAYKANVDTAVQEKNKKCVTTLLESIEASDLTAEEKRYCREYAASKTNLLITK